MQASPHLSFDSLYCAELSLFNSRSEQENIVGSWAKNFFHCLCLPYSFAFWNSDFLVCLASTNFRCSHLLDLGSKSNVITLWKHDHHNLTHISHFIYTVYATRSNSYSYINSNVSYPESFQIWFFVDNLCPFELALWMTNLLRHVYLRPPLLNPLSPSRLESIPLTSNFFPWLAGEKWGNPSSMQNHKTFSGSLTSSYSWQSSCVDIPSWIRNAMEVKQFDNSGASPQRMR